MMSNDDATPLAALMTQMLRETGLDRKLKEHAVLESWDEVVGVPIAHATTSKQFRYGKLTVQMVSAVWRYEITMRREEIRAMLNQRAGAELVKEMVIR